MAKKSRRSKRSKRSRRKSKRSQRFGLSPLIWGYCHCIDREQALVCKVTFFSNSDLLGPGASIYFCQTCCNDLRHNYTSLVPGTSNQWTNPSYGPDHVYADSVLTLFD